MTILPVARLAFWVAFWRLQVPPVPELEPPRIVGPPPSLIEADDPHVGMRWHSDDPRDQAVTIQVTGWALTL